MKMWIARDDDGDLFLHETKPILINDWGVRFWQSADSLELLNHHFPEVTFENSPMEVELVIKK